MSDPWIYGHGSNTVLDLPDQSGDDNLLLQSIYGSQSSQLNLSRRQSEVPLQIVEEEEHCEWSDDEPDLLLSETKSSGRPTSTKSSRGQLLSRPRSSIFISKSSSNIIYNKQPGNQSNISLRRPSSARPSSYSNFQQKLAKPVNKRPMSAAVPSSRSSVGSSASRSTTQLTRPRQRPKSAFVGSRSVSELDPPSSWDDLSAIPTQKPHIRTTTPVYRTNVPEYINFWEGKPLSERQFGVPMHERNAWVRPKSDYGTRFKGVKKKSSKDESGSADDIGSGVQEAWGEQNTKTNDKEKTGHRNSLDDITSKLLGLNNDSNDDKNKARDTSENNRDRNAYRSDTHSDNRYGLAINEESDEEGGNDDFFTKSDDKLPEVQIPTKSSNSHSNIETSLGDNISGSPSKESGEDVSKLPPLVPEKNLDNFNLKTEDDDSDHDSLKKIDFTNYSNKAFYLDDSLISESETLLDRPSSRAWLSAKLSLTKNSTRFELPLNMKDLHGVQPVAYLQKYCIISERKASHYTRVFHKYLKTPFGTVIPRKDLLSALKDVFYESASDEQIRDILDIVQLPDSVKDVEIRLFVGIAALGDRILKLSSTLSASKSSPALTEYGKHRQMVEEADFEALDWKLRGCTIEDSLRNLFERI